MSAARWDRASERWARLLLRLYPVDFREEMGESLVETYRDRCRVAVERGGIIALALIWVRALLDSLFNGIGERMQPAISWRRSGNWGRDTERVLRRLVRAPLFVATMVGTLTVGLGAFAVVYAVVDKVLLEPLPYERPDDLYIVWRDYSWFDLDRGWLGGTDVVALQQAGGVIQDAAGLRRTEVTLSTTSAEAADPEQIAVMVTSPNLFPLLGARPLLGRVFAPEETGPGRPSLLVLSHDLWTRRFSADSGVIGREVRVNSQPSTVIGVMPRNFRFVRHVTIGEQQSADAYITLPEALATTNPGAGSYGGIVRAKPGTSPEALSAAVTAVGSMIDRRDFEGRGLRLVAQSMKEDLIAGVRPALMVLSAAAVLLVLVLAMNMANLLLVRAAQREHEFAISRALGANPLALVRATLLEAGALGLLGGVCGAIIAVWVTQALVGLAPLNLPRRDSIAVDWQTAGIVIGVATLLGLLAGVAPAVWATRGRLATLLRSAAVRGGGGGHGATRRAMVVAQVALSLVLLTAGGLVVRSFEGLLRTNPGFVADGVLTLRVPAPVARYPNDTVVLALHERIERELAAIPGVTAVGGTSGLPLTGGANQTTVRIPGAPGNSGEKDHDAPLVDYMAARPGYLHALGIRVLQGSDLTPGSAVTPAARREALIDRTLAAHFFPTGNPVGARIPFGNDTLTVVGVVEHARLDDVHADGRPQVYVRDERDAVNYMSFVLRSNRPPGTLATEARAAIRRIDSQLAVADVRPMEEIVNDRLRQQRVSAVLLAGFALGALLLAAMGLFGVVAGAVSRRRHEIAVRLALGADHSRVMRLILGEGARLVCFGLLLGAPGIWFAGRALDDVLVGVSAFDPLTLIGVAVGLALVALLACWFPARRVASIEPARSLREG